ncbi:Endogenous retrovirus group 3 member 1 Env polyprotein, partial [Plecturocebus cupreus]
MVQLLGPKMDCVDIITSSIKIITNEIFKALDLLAVQSIQMRNIIYQGRLALNYLLASEGGVCGKFNLTNCCIEIYDNRQAVMEIIAKMRKLAHVPVQFWKGWTPDSLF